MKKNYIAPRTVVMTVAAAQMICGSPGSMTISNSETSSQWSREGDSGWDDEE